MRVNKNTKQAFIWICEIFAKANVDFCISGGLAAKIYGSPRPLYDIDIDLEDKDFYKVASLVDLSEYITFGPARFKDKQWNILLLTLHYKDQYIDICSSSSAKIYSHKDKKWVAYPFNLEKSIPKKIFGKKIITISKESLIEYKSLLNRKEDAEDIKNIK